MLIKRLLRGRIPEQTQYAMDFTCLAVLVIPFLPIRTEGIRNILYGLGRLGESASSGAGNTQVGAYTSSAASEAGWITDFAVSVDSRTSSAAGIILILIWLLGAVVMGALVFRAYLQLSRIDKSSLPLENPDACRIFRLCCAQLNLKKTLPAYTTPWLKSPVMTGIFRPRIYIPLHVIHDSDESELRYIMLHELNHYVRRDAVANLLMNLAGTVYWFNPFVWYALRQMRNDRETACDAGVLAVLDRQGRTGYGHTLISFAEKLALFPFTSGIGGSARQLEKRIRNIVSYHPLSAGARLRGAAAFILSMILLASFVPFFPSFAASGEHYRFNTEGKNIDYIDLSSAFDGSEGSFVLYDAGADSWQIYNPDTATTRVSPNSTYKIYDALLALESGIISPEDSDMTWDGTEYPISAWNSDQDLSSALRNSVNWYFQSVDSRLGSYEVSRFFNRIGYGNGDTSGGLDSYWMESTLEISPVEQVELLTELYYNEFGFSQENIDAVKNSLCLFSNGDSSLYGKTGSGQVDGKEVTGWFVGYVEQKGNVYFFAVNLRNSDNASGSAASDLALSVLESRGIWEQETAL